MGGFPRCDSMRVESCGYGVSGNGTHIGKELHGPNQLQHSVIMDVKWIKLRESSCQYVRSEKFKCLDVKGESRPEPRVFSCTGSQGNFVDVTYATEDQFDKIYCLGIHQDVYITHTRYFRGKALPIDEVTSRYLS